MGDAPSTTRAPSTGRRALFTALRLSVALLILYWVGRNLPWKDELTFADGQGHELVASGRIDGDWKSERVRFFPADPAELDARWPLGAREPVSRGEPVTASRRGEHEKTGFDWHPGMPRAFREMDTSLLLLAEGLFLLSNLTIVTRWWRLLANAGCPTSWWNALRLTFLGLFFNNVMPGATGGDLVKGVAVARENPGRGAEALVTVLVDRIFGMLALALLALVVILAWPHESFETLRKGLLVGLGICAVGGVLYSSKSFRKKVGLSALVSRLPIGDKLRSLDRAALLYLKQPGALAVAALFSVLNHVLVTLGVYVLGLALGVPESHVSMLNYFVIVPVANLISALPLAPGGWGVGELAFRSLFQMVGASPAMGVAVSVTFRLSQLVIGLFGGITLLLPITRSELPPKG